MHRKGVQGMLAGATSINHSLTHCPRSLASSIALLTCSGETTMMSIFSLSLHVHCPPSSFLLSVPRDSPGGLALPDASYVFWLLVGCGQWGALAGLEVGRFIYPTSYLWVLARLAVSLHKLHEPVRQPSPPSPSCLQVC